MGPLYSTSLSEKRLSFRKNAIIGDANNTNSGLSAAMAAASIHNDSNQSGGLTLAPSQVTFFVPFFSTCVDQLLCFLFVLVHSCGIFVCKVNASGMAASSTATEYPLFPN